MSARNLSPLQFNYTAPDTPIEQKKNEPYKEPIPHHVVDAYNKKGEWMGNIMWNKRSGSIEDIRTREDMRRKGIATATYKAAQKIAAEKGIKSPKHSAKRTEEGEAWAKSTGEELPKRKKSGYGFSPYRG